MKNIITSKDVLKYFKTNITKNEIKTILITELNNLKLNRLKKLFIIDMINIINNFYISADEFEEISYLLEINNWNIIKEKDLFIYSNLILEHDKEISNINFGYLILLYLYFNNTLIYEFS